MAIFLAFLVLLGIAMAIGGARYRPGRQSPKPRGQTDVEAQEPATLSVADPIEALRVYGTAEDAALLAEQGIDLAALGYRAPSGE